MANLNGVIALAIVLGAVLVSATPVEHKQRQLGAKECTRGPSFWCSNLINATSCHAVRHCIQTVWEKQNVPEDNDSICKICKDMVTQARDQLRSNETMEELKEVFEGSCNLIPIKPVKKECCKLADDFIPELVEALSSQMNPDQVCSVAGLCNNAEIDKILASYYAGALDGSLKEDDSVEIAPKPSSMGNPRLLSCGKCNSIATLITTKFQSANRDDLLENILHLCGEMSSFSDACSSIVLTYFNDMYEHLKENLNADGICHMSGACASNYHRHPEDEKDEPDSIALTDDIPCELCEQLVKHLRDMLVANTTESEFKQVLEGLCKQTKGFKQECLSIVDQYYDVIYKTLVDNLDANGACFMIGVCPKGLNMIKNQNGGIMPLLPAIPPAEIHVTIRKKLGANEPKFTQEEIHSMTLPIDHLMGAANPAMLEGNGQLCTLCEYILHFIQETLATPKTEDDIKRTVNNVCEKLPNGVRGECHNFIDMYGDAVIALMIQGLDPAQLCPQMSMCPHNENRHDMEVIAPKTIHGDESDKPTCPLCLFAVEQAQQEIKNDKSKQHIRSVLNHLCSRLPEKLRAECVDFIQTYSNELIDKLISDFKPQEICVSLKLCESSSHSYLEDMGISLEDSSSEEKSTENEIDSEEELPVKIAFESLPAPNCWLCEEVIKNVEKRINKRTLKDDIKVALHHACGKLRKNMQTKCNSYVNRYGDKIALFIQMEMEPKMICRELGMCLWSHQEDLEIDEALKYDVIAMPQNADMSIVSYDRLTGLDDDLIIREPPTCVLCEFVMTKLEADLKNKTKEDEIKKAVETVCHRLPKSISQSCNKFVDQYADAIIAMIGSVPPKEICTRLQLCADALDRVVTDEVIECGVCHGVSLSLLPYLRKQSSKQDDDIKTQDLIAIACETLPAKYYQICSEMVNIYGQSILHLSQKKYVDEAHVCTEIGKCFDDGKSSLAFARISA